MELICPDCRAELTVADPQTATCAGHDGRYQILFDRQLGTSQPGAPAEAPRSVAAAAPAVVEDDPNVKYCPACDAPNPLTAQRCNVCRESFTLMSLTARRRPPATPLPDVLCTQHPEVQAVTRCRICSKGVCALCDFLLPGNVHVCPACLEKEPSDEISLRRVRLMIGADVIAAYCTVMFVLLFSGTLHRAFGNSPEANMIIGNGILWPAVIGVVVSLIAVDRRLRNSMGIWVAVVWNSINMGLYLLLIIIGLARR